MEATYISNNSFSVVGLRTDDFTEGRRLKLDCGIDGTKYASIVSAVFTTVTTVVVDEAELTSNLSDVMYSPVKPGAKGNLPDHAHTTSEGDGGHIPDPITTFSGLSDTPSTYSEGQYLQSTTSGTIWSTVSGGGSDVQTFLDLEDTPVTYPVEGEYIGITIDSDLISSSVVDFPLILNISENSGLSSEDLSKFFEALDCSIADVADDFSIQNDDLWNWPATNPHNSWTYALDGTFNFSRNESSANTWDIITKFKFSGDYDVQVDFGINDIGTSNNQIGIVMVGDNYHALLIRYRTSNDRYYWSLDGSTGAGGSSHYTGKFRATRTGTLTTLYSWTGTSWTIYKTGTTNTNDVQFQLYNVQTSSQLLDAWYDNFVVNVGTIVWPNGYPYRKKIMVKDSNDIQLPVEIELWDQINKKAVLHTKVPFVSGQVNTELSLYYSKDMEDNVDYIGDVATWIDSDITGEEFTGVDGTTMNTSKWITNYDLWSAPSEYDNVSVTIDNNQLAIQNSVAVIGRGTLVSKFRITGDLDIQIDWIGDDELSIYIWQDITSTENRSYVGANTTLIRSNSNIAGSWEGQTSVAKTNDYGKVRLVRTGSSLLSQYQDGTQAWQTLDTMTCVTTDVHIVLLSAFTVAQINTGRFDNFVINAGSVIEPGPGFSVWENDHIGVWSLAQDPSGGVDTILDSTINANHGNPVGTMTSSDLVDGITGKCLEFDGTDDAIEVQNHNNLQPLTQVTYSAAAYLDDWDVDLANAHFISCTQTGGWAFDFDSPNNMDATVNVAGTYHGIAFNHTVLSSGWHVFHCTYDGVNLKFYIDGDLIGTKPVSGTITYNTTTVPLVIGAEAGAAAAAPDYWPGRVDDARVSSVARSASWVKAEANSIMDSLVTYNFNYPSKYLAPNTIGTGLVFKDFDLLTGSTLFTDLIDTPSSYIDGQYLRTTASGIEAIDGIILKSPDQSEWLLGVTNSGTLTITGV